MSRKKKRSVDNVVYSNPIPGLLVTPTLNSLVDQQQQDIDQIAKNHDVPEAEKADLEKPKYYSYTQKYSDIAYTKPVFSDKGKIRTTPAASTGYPNDNAVSLGQMASEDPVDPFLESYSEKRSEWGTIRTKFSYDSTPVSNIYVPDHPTEISAVTPSDKEDFFETTESLQIIRLNEKTIVSAIVIDNENPDNNEVNAIKCYGGTVIGGYAYDRTRDAYIVQCCSYSHIGYISFSYSISMKNVGTWQARIPIPAGVLEKYLTTSQRTNVENIRKSFPSPKYTLQFVQMSGCH